MKSQLLALGKLVLFHWVPAISALYLLKYDHSALGLLLIVQSLIAGVHILKE
jgi:hypothetical protein